jgi:hypothetical protein
MNQIYLKIDPFCAFCDGNGWNIGTGISLMALKMRFFSDYHSLTVSSQK